MMTLSDPTRPCFADPGRPKGFTLLEVLCSLGILSIICSSAMVIMSRNKDSSFNVTMRLRALEVARENIEQILVSQTIEEQTEYGVSEKYPAIEWESTIETFYAPLEGQTWARAISVARYKDMQDVDQEVELEHWLSRVTDAEMDTLGQLEGADSQLYQTIEEAGQYAGVDELVLLEWVQNGMVQTDEGYFIQANLDLFLRTNGNPSPEELQQQALTGTFNELADQAVDAHLDRGEPEQGTFDPQGGR